MVSHRPAVSQHPLLLLRVNTRTVTVTVFSAIPILVVIDALLNVAQYGLGYTSVFGLVEFFDLDRERNLPTWYASTQLAFAALLLVDTASAARLDRRPHFHRLMVLAFGFCYLSVDEYMSLHERLGSVLQSIFGVALALLAFLCGASWLRDLARNLRRQFLTAGGVYVGGALGFDLVGAMILQLDAALLLYAMSTTIEEGLELLGIALFVTALLDLRTNEPVRLASLSADNRGGP